jgi:hypothetical protein
MTIAMAVATRRPERKKHHEILSFRLCSWVFFSSLTVASQLSRFIFSVNQRFASAFRRKRNHTW